MHAVAVPRCSVRIPDDDQSGTRADVESLLKRASAAGKCHGLAPPGVEEEEHAPFVPTRFGWHAAHHRVCFVIQSTYEATTSQRPTRYSLAWCCRHRKAMIPTP